MKHKISTLLLSLVMAIGTLAYSPAYAGNNNAVEKARHNLKQATQNAEQIMTMEADSISETVVYEVAAESQEPEDTDAGRHNGYSLSEAISGNVVAVTAIIFGTFIPLAAMVLIVFFIMRYFTQKKKMFFDTVNNAVNHGINLPDSFFQSQKTAGNKLQSGLVWIGWGVAILAFRFFISPTGYIFLFIGFSRLAVYVVENYDSIARRIKSRKKSTGTDSPSDAEQD